MARKSGVLLHITSLPGGYGCGSFGDEAKSFCEFLADCGFTFWQTLPFTMPGIGQSPYRSYSAFGGNPWFIDLPTLCQNGLITTDELHTARQTQPYTAEYERILEERMPLLAKAAQRAAADADIVKAVEFHVKHNAQVAKFCEFMATNEANGGLPWQQWTVREYDAAALFKWQWTQYEFMRQWTEIKAYANGLGIGIIGDIPIYVDGDSADVWANRELFQLDADGYPLVEAGCPPDFFSEDGQLWHNPIYDWNAMRQSGFVWWRERMHAMFVMFDGVRLDHFRGFESYWAVPAGQPNARGGKWKKGPGRALIDVLRDEAAGRLVIAEDLGEITPAVERLVKYSGFPGMRVMQFGLADRTDNIHKPHNYISDCVAYTGTHDNNTFLGFLFELASHARDDAYAYIGAVGADVGSATNQAVRELFTSAADTVIIPVQDLLGYGGDTRMNIPGIEEGQWRFRVTAGQLAALDTAALRRLNEITNRTRVN